VRLSLSILRAERYLVLHLTLIPLAGLVAASGHAIEVLSEFGGRLAETYALFADEPPDRRREVAEVQSVPPGRTERKGRHPVGAFVQVEATYSLR